MKFKKYICDMKHSWTLTFFAIKRLAISLTAKMDWIDHCLFLFPNLGAPIICGGGGGFMRRTCGLEARWCSSHPKQRKPQWVSLIIIDMVWNSLLIFFECCKIICIFYLIFLLWLSLTTDGTFVSVVGDFGWRFCLWNLRTYPKYSSWIVIIR